MNGILLPHRSLLCIGLLAVALAIFTPARSFAQESAWRIYMSQAAKAESDGAHKRQVELLDAAIDAASKITLRLSNDRTVDDPNPRLFAANMLKANALKEIGQSDEYGQLISDLEGVQIAMMGREGLLKQKDAVAPLFAEVNRIHKQAESSLADLGRAKSLLDKVSSILSSIKPSVLSQTSAYAEASVCLNRPATLKQRELLIKRGLQLGETFEDDCYEIVDELDKQLADVYLQRGAYLEAIEALQRKIKWLKLAPLRSAATKQSAAKANWRHRLLPLLLLLAKAQALSGQIETAETTYQESLDLAESEYGIQSRMLEAPLEQFADFLERKGTQALADALRARKTVSLQPSATEQ